MDVSTDAYSDSVSAALSSESSLASEDAEDSYFWQMLTFGYTVEWCAAAPTSGRLPLPSLTAACCIHVCTKA